MSNIKIVSVTDISIRNILQNCDYQALSLYLVYAEIAVWQGSYIVKATTGFVAKRLHVSEDTIIKYKKQLLATGVIKDIKRKKDGKIVGHYVQVKHLTGGEIHPLENTGDGDFPPLENTDTSALQQVVKVHPTVNQSALQQVEKAEAPKTTPLVERIPVPDPSSREFMTWVCETIGKAAYRKRVWLMNYWEYNGTDEQKERAYRGLLENFSRNETEKFVAYYEQQDWKTGGKKIKNMEATIRNWVARANEYSRRDYRDLPIEQKQEIKNMQESGMSNEVIKEYYHLKVL